MSRTRSQRLVALAAGALLLAPLAGCGGDDKGSGAKATSSSSSSPSAPSSADAAEAQEFVRTLVAAMQDKRTAHMVLDLGSSLTANAEVEYTNSGTRMSMDMVSGSQTVRVIVADGALYLQQKAGGKYTKIAKDDPTFGALLDQVGSIGPKASLTTMKAGIEKVTDKGPVTVGGEQLTRYELTVDTAKAVRVFGAGADTPGMPATITYDVYVDADRLMREVRMKANGQELVMKVSDWGKPVDITIPTGSQIAAKPKS